ncbi:MAG: hypothetical protein H7240_11745 [Glaciimonas sp.]|nr:hypothetical protein [Glaciimonas sp.]
MPIPARMPGTLVPLSLEQQGLWFLWQVDPDDSAYNIAYTQRWRGALDIAALHNPVLICW